MFMSNIYEHIFVGMLLSLVNPLFNSDLEVDDEDKGILGDADIGAPEVLDGAGIGRKKFWILNGFLEFGGQRIFEVASDAGGHGGANTTDIVAGLVGAGGADAAEDDEAILILRCGEDDDFEGVAEADAFAEHIEGGFAGEAGADAEPAVGAFDMRLFEIGEVALIRFGAFDVLAAVLSEDGFGEHALEGAELDVKFDGGRGGGEEGREEQELDRESERQVFIMRLAEGFWSGGVRFGGGQLGMGRGRFGHGGRTGWGVDAGSL